MTTAVAENWDEINFFTKKEFLCKCSDCKRDQGVDFILVKILDLMRKDLGFPFRITSGFRCPKHPQAKDLKSSHARGLAVDIFVSSSVRRFKLLEYVLKRGTIKRIGVGMDFIHLDIDDSPDKAQRVMWTYY